MTAVFRKNARSAIALGLLTASCALPVGCNSPAAPTGTTGNSYPDMEGKSATIEYRPAQATTGFLQKQRVGIIRKFTDSWIVLEEQGLPIAIPREMVLEVRVEKK